MIQHVFDAILVTGLILGMLGAVYTAYAFVPNPLLQKFSVAFTLMLIGLFIAGFIVGLSALDATFFPHSMILSTILGVIIWVLFGLLILFILLWEWLKRKQSREYERILDQQIGKVEEQNTKEVIEKYFPQLNLPDGPWEDPQLQTLMRWQSARDREEKEKWISSLWQSVLSSIPWEQVILLVWPFVLAGMLAWGRAAFIVVTQGYTLLYIGSTILVVVGGGGFIYGFQRPSDDKPQIFSLDKRFVIIAGVLTFGLSILIHFQLGTSAIPIFFRVLIFILIIIPVLTAAMGLAPFLKAKVYKLTTKGEDLGRIGLGFLFFGFLLQLIQPLVDLWH